MNLRDKVYLVSTGSYSDTSTDSIHSTREKAEARVKQLERENSNSEVNDIEEWELDASHPEREITYIVHISGDGILGFKGHGVYPNHPQNTLLRITSFQHSPFWNVKEKYKYNIVIYSTSYELAEKIAIEKQQAFIRVIADHSDLPLSEIALLIGLEYRS